MGPTSDTTVQYSYYNRDLLLIVLSEEIVSQPMTDRNKRLLTSLICAAAIYLDLSWEKIINDKIFDSRILTNDVDRA